MILYEMINSIKVVIQVTMVNDKNLKHKVFRIVTAEEIAEMRWELDWILQCWYGQGFALIGWVLMIWNSPVQDYRDDMR